MGVLYKLTAPSGKSYIGISSKSLEARWRQHRANAAKGRGLGHDTECKALYSAMRKYGAATFSLETLGECADWFVLCELERAAIAAHGTYSPDGYNLTFGGEGAVGCVPSDKTRQNMSEGQKRLNASDPILRDKRMVALAKAVTVRAEKWWKRTPEERRAWGIKHGEAVSRGHSTPESRKLRSEVQLKRFRDPLEREKMSRALRGRTQRVWTDEQKQQAAELRRREWADPVMREKRLRGFAAWREQRRHGTPRAGQTAS